MDRFITCPHGRGLVYCPTCRVEANELLYNFPEMYAVAKKQAELTGIWTTYKHTPVESKREVSRKSFKQFYQ